MKIGILGGGQLGRMLALAGYPLGLNFCFYDPNPDCCAKSLGELFTAEYSDTDNLLAFCEKVDVITYEHENIPLQTIELIAQTKTIFPNPAALRASQNRLLEKQLFTALHIPTVKYHPIHNTNDLQAAPNILGFPFIVKTCSGGYDGKGQTRINNQQELDKLQTNLKNFNHIAEQLIHFKREVSMIGVKNSAGTVAFYDISENEHRSGILIQARNQPQDPMFDIATEYTKKILEEFSYIGTIAVEYFQVGEQLLANEFAPRVHNTGHWTIEGAVCSQFENHLRAILNWPLGDTSSIGYATMTNIIGEMPNKRELLKDPTLHLHDYGKPAKPGRKLGHTNSVRYL